MFSRFYLSHILVPFSPALYHGELFPVVCTNEPSLYFLSTPHEVLGSREGEGEQEGGILIQITVKEVRLPYVIIFFLLVCLFSPEPSQCLPTCGVPRLRGDPPVQDLT